MTADELQPIRVNIQLTPKDYLQALRRMLRWAWMVPALCVGMSLYVLGKAGWDFPLFWAVSWPVELPLLVVSLLFPELSARFWRWRMLRATPAAMQPTDMVFSPESVQSLSASGAGEAKWPAFQKATQAGRAFQLFFAYQAYYLLPYRFFSGAEERNAFRALVRTQLGAKARRLKDE